MFQWLSQYNYDFALAAIPIQLLLLIFYCSHAGQSGHDGLRPDFL